MSMKPPAANSGQPLVAARPAAAAADARPRLRLAVLHETVAAQLREKRESLDQVDVVFNEPSIERFRQLAPSLKPNLVIVDLKLLGPDPVKAMDELNRISEVEKTVIVYSFAKSDTIRKLITEKTSILKSPLNFGALKASLLNFLLNDLWTRRKPSDPYGLAVESTVRAGTPRRFNDAQLGRLAEITSVVDCECPNHLSAIISSVSEFEEYSKNCLNKDDADAKIHALLYNESSKARSILEGALVELVKHEKIAI